MESHVNQRSPRSGGDGQCTNIQKVLEARQRFPPLRRRFKTDFFGENGQREILLAGHFEELGDILVPLKYMVNPFMVILAEIVAWRSGETLFPLGEQSLLFFIQPLGLLLVCVKFTCPGRHCIGAKLNRNGSNGGSIGSRPHFGLQQGFDALVQIGQRFPMNGRRSDGPICHAIPNIQQRETIPFPLSIDVAASIVRLVMEQFPIFVPRGLVVSGSISSNQLAQPANFRRDLDFFSF